MEKQKPVTLGEILEWGKNFSNKEDNELEELYLYSSLEVYNKANMNLDDLFFLDAPPSGGDDEEDVFPLFVRENKLEMVCGGYNITEVVAFALQQKYNATTQELVDSLEFYLITDKFLDFNKRNRKEIRFVIMPTLTKGELILYIEKFGEKRLYEYNLITLGQGIVLYTYDKKSACAPFADYIDRQRQGVLVITINEDFWSHLLYRDGYFSPSEYILPGQENKKKPKMGFGANLEAFKMVFPCADISIIESYLYQAKYRGLERNGETIKDFYISEGMSEKLIQGDGEFYVTPDDRFPVGDSRQAFDFMRYLGYGIPVSLFQ